MGSVLTSPPYLRLLRARYQLARRWRALRGPGDRNDMARFIDLYRRIWREAAEKLGAEFCELADGIWKIRRGDRVTFVNNYRVQLDDPVLLDLVGRKALCARFLADRGLQVPEYETFGLDTMTRAQRFMARFPGAYFVVKPATGTSASRGVTTHIRTLRECGRAVALASLYGPEMLIERLIPGESYRILVLDGQVLHASRRTGVRVTGDGSRTIRQLVQDHRVGVPGLAGTLQGFDRDVEATLGAQGLSADAVPSLGSEVLVKSSPAAGHHVEVRTVYDEDATGLIGKGLREEAVRAAQTLNLRFVGVDVITLDPSVSLSRSRGVINELNTTPGLHHHYGLHHDSGLAPAIRVLQALLPSEPAGSPGP